MLFNQEINDKVYYTTFVYILSNILSFLIKI